MAEGAIKFNRLSVQQVRNISVTVPASMSAWIDVTAPANAVAVSGYHLEDLYLTMRTIAFNASTQKASVSIRNWASTEVTSTMSIEFLIQP